MVPRLLVVLAVLAAHLATCSARPSKLLGEVDTAEFKMCPFKTHFDDDSTRIPRKIKTIKCIGQPANQCQELMDKVWVFDKVTQTFRTETVSVVCVSVAARKAGVHSVPGE